MCWSIHPSISLSPIPHNDERHLLLFFFSSGFTDDLGMEFLFVVLVSGFHFFCQVVANCLSSLQEIWSSEASTSEEASREREALLSKPVIYYFLNRYVLSHRHWNKSLSMPWTLHLY